MRIEKGEIREDLRRDIYWIKIRLFSDNDSRTTELLICTSIEYLSDLLMVPRGHKIEHEHLEKWFKSVEEKWLKFGEAIFDQDIHFEVCATTQEGREAGLAFLSDLA